MIKRRIVYLLALAGSVLFYVGYQQWVAWVLLLIVVLLPWLSLLLSIAAMVCMRVGLDAPAKIPMGSTEKVDLKVSSKLPLLPYKSKIRITKPLTGESWTLKPDTQLPTEHCGQLHVELYKPGVCDFLGVFRLRIRRKAKQTVLVLPTPVEMEIPPDLLKQLEPRWRRKPGGGYAENYEIRQYHPGDSLNQIHWKLSAKVGELMLREPMEPERGLLLLTMDLNGTAAELDRKLGQLLWVSRWMLKRELTFDIRVLTANGIDGWTIRNEENVTQCVETLLSTPYARTGSVKDEFFKAAWRCHIGGEQSEA